MGWVQRSCSYVQIGWIADPPHNLRLHLYCDADFAGCQTTNRCTSGVFMAIEGPHTFFPVAAGSKMQHITSHSTTQAEAAAGSHGLRQVGLPGLVLWDVIMGHVDPKAIDAKPPRQSILTGRLLTPKRRHLW